MRSATWLLGQPPAMRSSSNCDTKSNPEGVCRTRGYSQLSLTVSTLRPTPRLCLVVSLGVFSLPQGQQLGVKIKVGVYHGLGSKQAVIALPRRPSHGIGLALVFEWGKPSARRVRSP